VLDEKLVALCRGKNFAALTTLFGDGRPQTQIMWVDCDDDHVIINTERHRAKFKNLSADPRVAITVWDSANPYSYVEVRGRVVETVGGAEAREHINRLSNRYLDRDYGPEIVSERVIVRIAPEELAGFG
jgi:PPOX class probable F420-dependent enzyme